MRLLGLAQPAAGVPRLETRRLHLRAPALADFEAWARLRGGSADYLQPWEPRWTTHELTRPTYRARLRAQARAIVEDRSLPYFLFELATGDLAGGITVTNIRRGVSQSATIGYWMGERFAGRGLMSEAVDALVTRLFRDYGLHRVEAATLPTNARSVALLERNGFRLEGCARGYLEIAGRWQDHLLFARLADDRTAPRR